MSGTVAVIGSLNIDFITTTPRVPQAGETLTAISFETGFGGKGANQAVACARLSGSDSAITRTVEGRVKTYMVGSVGDDSFGTDYTKALGTEGIDTSLIRTIRDTKTGIANVIVEETTGENRILVSKGANHASGDTLLDLVPQDADVVVFQLEIPLALVIHNIKLAHSQGKYVILNPAPAVNLPSDIYSFIDCLIMNESEAAILSKDKRDTLHDFLVRGIRDLVVVTLGADGVSFATKDNGQESRVPGRKVKVVDTTAAGDTFVGALATQIARNNCNTSGNAKQMIDFANKAAARTVEKPGAMAAIPRLYEINAE